MHIHFDSRLSGNRIKPVGNISSGCLNQRPWLCLLNICLYQLSQVINLTKQYNPAISGSVVFSHLTQSVVSLTWVLWWDVLLDIGTIHLFLVGSKVFECSEFKLYKPGMDWSIMLFIDSSIFVLSDQIIRSFLLFILKVSIKKLRLVPAWNPQIQRKLPSIFWKKCRWNRLWCLPCNKATISSFMKNTRSSFAKRYT